MKVTVEQGQIHVNTVHLVVDTASCKVFMADTRAKRPQVVAYGGSDAGLDVFIAANEHSIGVEYVWRWTRVSIEIPQGAIWHIMAESDRYSIRIAVWQDAADAPCVWSDEEAP